MAFKRSQRIGHGVMAFSLCTVLYLVLGMFASIAQDAQAHSDLTFNPKGRVVKIDLPKGDYKSQRLAEMAQMWKGTILEKHTVPLLAMLLQEDGTLTAERRHDCHKGVCYGIGFMGHNICSRGTPLIYLGWGDTNDQDNPSPYQRRYYCSWKNGKSPQQQFEEAYPAFSTEWRVQFAEYTLRMTQCFNGGSTEKQCIQGWNSLEKGRLAKVDRHKAMVLAAI